MDGGWSTEFGCVLAYPAKAGSKAPAAGLVGGGTERGPVSGDTAWPTEENGGFWKWAVGGPYDDDEGSGLTRSLDPLGWGGLKEGPEEMGGDGNWTEAWGGGLKADASDPTAWPEDKNPVVLCGAWKGVKAGFNGKFGILGFSVSMKISSCSRSPRKVKDLISQQTWCVKWKTKSKKQTSWYLAQ